MSKAADSIRQANGGSADHGIINLTAGSYQFGSGYNSSFSAPTSTGWLTVQGAEPGVVINSSDSHGLLRTKRVALKNLKTYDVGIKSGYFSDAAVSMIWCDACEFEGPGQCIPLPEAPWIDGPYHWYDHREWLPYVTNSTVYDAPYGIKNLVMARELHMDGICIDAFQSTNMAVNSGVRNHFKTPNIHHSLHTDAFVWYARSPKNVIVHNFYTLNSKAQQIFFNAPSTANMQIRDLAIVNAVFDHDVPDLWASQITQNVQSAYHVLLHHITLTSQQFFFGTPNLNNLSIRGSHFYKMYPKDGAAQFVPDANAFLENNIRDIFLHNHVSGHQPGFFDAASLADTDTTLGDLGLDNDNANSTFSDFLPPGVLQGRVLTPIAPADFNRNERSLPASIGGLE